MDLRPAELMGRWYPATADLCDAALATAVVPDGDGDAFGAIVPHAGWTYSGTVAFEALAAVQRRRPDADLVVVFGGHLGPRDPMRVFLGGAWETPYGPAEIAGELAEDIAMGIECDPETPDEYYDDNAVEVVMPMVKKLWPDARFLTIGVPPTERATKIGAEVLDLARRRGYERIVAVGSTDLTHYGPNYRYVPHGRGRVGLDWVKNVNDPELIAKLEAFDSTRIVWTAQRSRNACCPGAAAAAMAVAKGLGAQRGVVTRYTTSYDVRPHEDEPTSFVGYVGVVLER
ncbi:MAG: AmmeMemoRadiSam system protein B [Deltaproteobacteria bacterium]